MSLHHGKQRRLQERLSRELGPSAARAGSQSDERRRAPDEMSGWSPR
jgi:hypothetical protein